MRRYFSYHTACVHNFEYRQINDIFIEEKYYKELTERVIKYE